MRLSRNATLILLRTAAALLITSLVRTRAPNAMPLLADGGCLLWSGWVLHRCRRRGASARFQEVIGALVLLFGGSTLEALVTLLAVPQGGFHTSLVFIMDALRITALLMLCHAWLRTVPPESPDQSPGPAPGPIDAAFP